jgi:hypothetical protein
MNGLSKKLRKLEANVVSEEIEPDSTRFDFRCMPEAEREIHSKAYDLLVKQKKIAEELYEKMKVNRGTDISAINFTEEEKIIVDKSNKLLLQRSMQLMDATLFQNIHFNDPICKYVFYARFAWFLSEMQEWLGLLWLEGQIIDDKTLCRGKMEEQFRQVEAKWRKWLSPESWDKFSKEHSKVDLASKFSEEEQKQQEKEDQEEILREEQEEAKTLRVKCPACTSKCEWYLKASAIAKR